VKWNELCNRKINVLNVTNKEANVRYCCVCHYCLSRDFRHKYTNL